MPRRSLYPRPCEGCGEMYQPRNARQKFCTIDCFYDSRRASPRPKAGTVYTTSYKDRPFKLVLQPNGKHVAEHRLVFEKHWGVKLKSWHRVMHKDDNTLNNDPENLVLSNAYAMEMLRQGKSIDKIGKDICAAGHTKTKTRQTKGGLGREKYCPICDGNRAPRTRARRNQADRSNADQSPTT